MESSAKISCKKISLKREHPEDLKGGERKAAIQCMISWLSSNSKKVHDEGKDAAEALAVYRGIGPEDEETHAWQTAT